MDAYEEICIMESQAVPLVYELIEKYKPKTYCEIGVHNGLSAAGIIFEMLKYHNDVYIEAYDAFEPVDKIEHNGKSVAGKDHQKKCEKRFKGIQSQYPNFTYKIIKGLTSDTLKKKRFDLTYIDGGHSYETVKYDYSMLQDSKVIIFDDYNLSEVQRAVDEIGKGYRLPYTTPNGKKKKWVIINED